MKFIFNKKKLLALIIFICVGQICAFLVFHFYKMNLFVALSVSSVVGFFASYREEGSEID